MNAPVRMPVERDTAGAALHTRKHVTPGTALDFILSDETRDTYNTVISSKNWNLDIFRSNPIALFNHNKDFIIGRWVNVRVENGQLRGRLELAEEDTSPRVNEIRSLVRQGFLRATSVGFRYSKSEPIDDRTIRIADPELREVSLVSVPSNHNALLAARSLNISPDTMRVAFGQPANECDDAKRPTGEPAAENGSSWTRKMPSIAERVQHAQNEHLQAKAALEQFSNNLDNNNITDEQVGKMRELTAAATAAEGRCSALQEMERAMGATAVPVRPSPPIAAPPANGNGRVEVYPPRPFAAPAEKIRDGEHIVRALVASVTAKAKKITPYEALVMRYGQDGHADPKTVLMLDVCNRGEGVNPLDFLATRAVTAPATTTTSGWASQLVETTNVDFMPLLMPASVAPGLAARGLRMSFGRSGVISIPMRVSTPTIAGSFVAEGAAIPVRQGAFTAVPFTPKKMAVISSWTREIGEHSNPAIEGLIRSAIQEDTSVALDSVLLDATAATSIRPAGLRAGVAGLTATAGGGFTALVGDVKQLLGALVTGSNGNLRQPVWIMNPTQAISISLTQNAGGDFPFKQEINNNALMGYPVIVSSNVPAGTVILVDAADFCWIEGSAPRFDLSDQAVLVYDDTAPAALGATGSPNVVGAPARSLWQTDSIGLRMIFDVNWGLRRSGIVAWTSSVTW